MFSAWYARREPTPEIKAIADDLYRFVVTRLRDPEEDEVGVHEVVGREARRVLEVRHEEERREDRQQRDELRDPHD